MSLKRKYSFYNKVAIIMSFIMLFELVAPSVAYALTSGPSQPEVQAFEPFGTSEMVDLFSGDFTYNIPLFELPGPDGGYPFNLAYHSGIGMDQEATWVGLGWSLNPGAINRNMRGLPDDFDGDEVKTELHLKKNWTAGLTTGFSWQEFAGNNALAAGISTRVYYNSYKGVGLTVSPNIGYSFSHKHDTQTSLGLNMSLDSNEGATLSPSLSFSAKSKEYADNTSGKIGTSASFSYNTNRGLSDLNLGISASLSKSYQSYSKKNETYSNSSVGKGSASMSSSISFSNTTYSPSVGTPMKGGNVSFGMFIGADAFSMEAGLNLKGDFSWQEIKDKSRNHKAYGYLNLQNAKEVDMMDFNREKDGPVSKTSTNLGIPSLTYDVYTVQGHGVGGMYRPFRNDIGVVHDPYTESDFTGGDLGFEFGAGFGAGVEVQMGINGSINHSYTRGGKWKNSDFDDKYKFNNDKTGSLYENVYWKRPGETVSESLQKINTSIGGFEATSVKLASISDLSTAFKSKKNSNINNVSSNTQKELEERVSRNMAILPLKNSEVAALGEFKNTRPNRNMLPQHHIGAITVNNTNGSRYNYGLPAYNHVHKEVVYSTEVGANTTCARFVNIPINGPDYMNANNTDKYYSKTETPPYAHSYMLTSIYGADYTDLTGNGPSDDDFGYWVKFQYKKDAGNYKWRAPYFGANFMEGQFSKNSDNKASYLYGERENWYLDTAETKTHIAIFYTSPREDAKGAAKEFQNLGENLSSAANSYKLDSIKLYSKIEFRNNPTNAIPIKTIQFRYNYDLCKNVENNINSNGGKLTLEKIWFESGNSKKGSLNPYEFNYNYTENPISDILNNPDYNTANTDRWGNYYPNTNDACRNFNYPYVVQNDLNTDLYAAAWSLKEIKLPSGGFIKVQYEADDYAYVQDKTAMQMHDITGTGATPNVQNGKLKLYDTPSFFALNPNWRKVYFNLQEPLDVNLSNTTIQNILYKYHDGQPIYYKVKLNLHKPSNSDIVEFVHGYADVDYTSIDGYEGFGVDTDCIDPNNSDKYNRAYVLLKQDNDTKLHPIVLAGLHYLKFELPERSTVTNHTQDENPGHVQAIMALVDVFFNMTDLFKNFYANRTNSENQFCRDIDASASFIKLNNVTGFKKGGGHRVKQISINDNWEMMNNSSSSSEYGQVYDYTTEGKDGKKMSSGVATYEPIIGGDENALKYVKKVESAKAVMARNTQYTFFEFPVNESYYSAASVGYSKVTVKSINTDNKIKTPTSTDYGFSSTGLSVHEFYTAKDFPIIVDETSLDKSKEYNVGIAGGSSSSSFKEFNLSIPLVGLGNININKLTASQGYAIELNDMHGKPYKVSNYAISNLNKVEESPYSWVQYNYFESDPISVNNTLKRRLNNELNTILSDKHPLKNNEAHFEKRLVGVDYEMFADNRETKSLSVVGGLNLDLDVTIPIPLPIPITIPLPWPNIVFDEKITRLAVTNKIIHRTGILRETIAYNDGSTVRTENLAFDAQTGRALLTQVNNDYDKPIYSYSIPAQWKYERMGAAYKNIGYKFKANFCKLESIWANLILEHNDDYIYTIQSVGNIQLPLIEGDEILITNGNVPKKGYILTKAGNTFFIRLENADQLYGALEFNQCSEISSYPFECMVIRSGNRNHLDVDVANIVALKDPTKDREVFTCETCFEVSDSNIISSRPEGSSIKYMPPLPPLNDCQIDGLNLFANFMNSFLGTENCNFEYPNWYFFNSQIGMYHPSESNSFRITFNGDTSKYCVFSYFKENISANNFDPCYENVVGLNPDGSYIYGPPFLWEFYPISSFPMYPNLAIVGQISNNYDLNHPNYDLFPSHSIHLISDPIKCPCSLPPPPNPNCFIDTLYAVDSILQVSVSTFSDNWVINFKSHIQEVASNAIINSIDNLSKFQNGTRGNWRLKDNYVYLTDRKGIDYTASAEINSYNDYATQPEANLADDGVFKMVMYDWKASEIRNGCSPNWVRVNTNTMYNPFGNVVENRDALDNYSAALYGYKGSLPIAVSANAQYAEIGFENFEEYKINYDYNQFQLVPNNICFNNSTSNDSIMYSQYVWGNRDQAHFTVGANVNIPIGTLGRIYVTSLVNHYGVNECFCVENSMLPNGQGAPYTITGFNDWAWGGNNFRNYTLTNPPVNNGSIHDMWKGVFVYKVAVPNTPNNNILYNDEKAHTGKKSLKIIGNSTIVQSKLSLIPGKKYLASMWVNTHNNNYSNQVEVLGNSTNVLRATGSIINGWQKIEAEFIAPQQGNISFNFSGMNSANPIYIDDVRIHPVNATMESHVYNTENYRLHATLDNNNFATFYYYDDAGNLFLVKKETERGIRTIQESRAYVKK